MKAIKFKRLGTADVMHLAEAATPKVHPRDVLVRVAAAGVNRPDLPQRAGFYGREDFGDGPLLGHSLCQCRKVCRSSKLMIPGTLITAFEAVSHWANAGPGTSVLVRATAVGIGCASVHTAHVLGARVLVTTTGTLASEVIALGAEAAFDDNTEAFYAYIRRHTGGAGVHAIFNPVGGDRLVRSLRSLRPGGCIVQIGLLNGRPNAFIPLEVLLPGTCV
jgi:NADPH2:quinone reductase